MPTTALEPVVEDNTGGLAAFAGSGAIAEKPAATKAAGAFSVRLDGFQVVKTGVDRPMAGEIAGMRLAGIDDAFELGVGEVSAGDDTLRQMRPIGRPRRRDRRHGDGFDKFVGVRLRVQDVDRLQPIGLVDAVGDVGLVRPRCLT